jgi:hypothetical protein
MPEVFKDVMENIPKLAEAGVYGIVIEGMKFFKAKPGTIRVGGDSVYPKSILKRDFLQIRQEAHRNGMRFYSGENRLRALGDDMCCCGIEGLPGFKGNDYNLCMIVNGKNPQPTERMKIVGTGGVLQELEAKRGHIRANCQTVILRPDAGGVEPEARVLQRLFGKGDE